MHAGKNFGLAETLIWTREYILIFVMLAAIPTVAYAVFGMTWVALPWLPIALVGTAVAFLIGFKNNASYDRTWEARKIWGAIVNSSRSWALMARDYVTNDHTTTPLSEAELSSIHRQLIYRHIAWLNALRFQLRQPKPWETIHHRRNRKYVEKWPVDEWRSRLEDALEPLLSEDDHGYVLSKGNRASHLLSLQSMNLKTLKQSGAIEDFRHMEMQAMLTDLFTQQGKCERIKNFPFPRQYATINLFSVWLFAILAPFGMVHEFAKLGPNFVWATIPFTAMVCWVFITMEKIGEASENPFQGGANDVPITALTRTIEIDLRQMLDETNTPPPIEATNQILL